MGRVRAWARQGAGDMGLDRGRVRDWWLYGDREIQGPDRIKAKWSKGGVRWDQGLDGGGAGQTEADVTWGRGRWEQGPDEVGASYLVCHLPLSGTHPLYLIPHPFSGSRSPIWYTIPCLVPHLSCLVIHPSTTGISVRYPFPGQDLVAWSNINESPK